MEFQILNEIRRTNELLEWAVYLLSAIVVLSIIRGTYVVVQNWKKIKKRSINDAARDLYEKESYDELIKFCTKELISNPRNIHCLYWKAKAKNRIGSTEGLEETVGTILDIAPRWKEDWMEIYIKKDDSQPSSAGNEG